MNIAGLQKMTLLDFPGRVACTVFLGGCNYRCPFCHNSELLCHDGEEFMTEDAFIDKDLLANYKDGDFHRIYTCEITDVLVK